MNRSGIRIILCLVAAIILASCTSEAKGTLVTTTTSIQTITPIAEPTKIPTSSPTPSPDPTETATPEKTKTPTLEPTEVPTATPEFDFSAIDYRPQAVEDLVNVMQSPNPVESPDAFDRWLQQLKTKLDDKVRSGWKSFETTSIGKDAFGTHIIEGKILDGGVFFSFLDSEGNTHVSMLFYDGSMRYGEYLYYFVVLSNFDLIPGQSFLEQNLQINNSRGSEFRMLLYTDDRVLVVMSDNRDDVLDSLPYRWGKILIERMNGQEKTGESVLDENVDLLYPCLLRLR